MQFILKDKAAETYIKSANIITTNSSNDITQARRFSSLAEVKQFVHDEMQIRTSGYDDEFELAKANVFVIQEDMGEAPNLPLGTVLDAKLFHEVERIFALREEKQLNAEEFVSMLQKEYDEYNQAIVREKIVTQTKTLETLPLTESEENKMEKRQQPAQLRVDVSGYNHTYEQYDITFDIDEDSQNIIIQLWNEGQDYPSNIPEYSLEYTQELKKVRDGGGKLSIPFIRIENHLYPTLTAIVDELKNTVTKETPPIDFEKIATEIFQQRANGELGTKWEDFKTADGKYDLNRAFHCFVDDVWEKKYFYAPSKEGEENIQTFIKAYNEFFYEDGIDPYQQQTSSPEVQARYNPKAIELFEKMYDAHLEKTKEKTAPKVDTALKEIIKQKDYKALSAHLKEGIGEYLKSDMFKNYLDFVAHFHKYSSNNIRLILGQMPQATQVAGFNKWKEMGRSVTKGSKAIYIYAPSQVIEKDKNGKPIKDQDGNVKRKTIFFLTPVFDASQTEGTPIPKPVYALEENLEDPKRFAKIFESLQAISPAPIAIEEIERAANGFYRPSENRIVIQKGLGQEMTIKTTIHEITHALLHADSQASFGSETYSQHEFEAESVAYIVANHLGIDSSGYSFGYLSSWTENGKKVEDFTASLETITKQAQEIINKLDSTLNKVYGITVPENKFEERLKVARETKETKQKTTATKEKTLNATPKK
ncbi:hypothetical protein SAMN02745116_00378 [Pilibacter termitis]|uniref:N-terminal domain-containing protein n=1 Tax=Pilibacter termitis TaxID=263852 RepID=A0A1T4KTL4_9ENTE|nr:ArdC-like ssDNA-binding domain-containing protein [Pilibacter termitis]SJZ45678.1 hypothetical protein SAMN02745116_00378 [Pilibacter termitis]